MPKSYKFSEEQVAELEAAKKKNKNNKNKRVNKRLEALLLRAKKVDRTKVSEQTGFCKQYITDITALYHNQGIKAITGNIIAAVTAI